MTETTRVPNTGAKRLSIFDLVDTDTNAEEDGRWFYDIFGTRDDTDPETNPGVDIKLRRSTCKAAARVRDRLNREARTIQRKGPLPPEVNARFNATILAEAVIVDWRGMFDADGSEIAFSPEKAQELLTRLPNWRQIINAMASDLDNFKAERAEAVLGN